MNVPAKGVDYRLSCHCERVMGEFVTSGIEVPESVGHSHGQCLFVNRDVVRIDAGVLDLEIKGGHILLKSVYTSVCRHCYRIVCKLCPCQAQIIIVEEREDSLVHIGIKIDSKLALRRSHSERIDDIAPGGVNHKLRDLVCRQIVRDCVLLVD